MTAASGLKILLQGEASECGLMCLGMLANAFGAAYTPATLRQAFPVGDRGMALPMMIEVAGRMGMSARAVKADLPDLRSLPRGAVLHWRFEHFVVLDKVTRAGLRLLDPALGVVEVSMREASEAFTGVALVLDRNPDFIAGAGRGDVLSQLLSRIDVKALARPILQVLVVALALEGTAIFAPMLQQQVVDGVALGATSDVALSLVLGASLLLLLQLVLGVMRSALVVHLHSFCSLAWPAQVFSHLTRLPMSYFGARRTGDIASRFAGLQAIQHAMSSRALTAVLDGVLAASAAVLMTVYSGQLAMVAALAFTLVAAVKLVAHNRVRVITTRRIAHTGREHAVMMETLRSIVTVKLQGKEGWRVHAWSQGQGQVVHEQANAARVDGVATAVTTFLVGVEVLVLVWLGAAMCAVGSGFSLGMLFAFMAYRGQFSSRMQSLIDAILEIHLVGVYVDRLADIVFEAPERLDGLPLESSAVPGAAALEFRGVSFRYPGASAWILDGVSFTVADGECVAITGPSGVGKSTIIKLATGLLSPTSGQILAFGVPIERLSLRSLRSALGVVMQDDDLLSGTVSENISFFDHEADEARVAECARIAEIHDAVHLMPMRYRSPVGEGGNLLSGGQRQRISLARALYGRPKALLLDESSSHLDAESESRINERLRAMSLTRVLVAHRRETIEIADRVLTLRQGKMLETYAASAEAA